jgi:hypothetical protein
MKLAGHPEPQSPTAAEATILTAMPAEKTIVDAMASVAGRHHAVGAAGQHRRVMTHHAAMPEQAASQ